MMLTNLASIARAAGLRVVEVSGWQTRGHGQMADIRTITCHHTAPGIRSLKPRVSLDVVINGRPGLDGPLAHYYLDRDGTVYVIAAGLCWHAGVSLSPDYTNSHAIGIEAEAAGDGWSEDWPSVQMNAYAVLCRALRNAFKLDTADIRGHKETCAPKGRKTDPSFSMPMFRKLVTTATFKLEDKNDMADITDAQMDKIADKVVAKLLTAKTEVYLDKNEDKKRDVQTIAQQIAAGASDPYLARQDIAALAAKVDALTELVTLKPQQ